MRWLDDITDSMDMSLSELRERVKVIICNCHLTQIAPLRFNPEFFLEILERRGFLSTRAVEIIVMKHGTADSTFVTIEILPENKAP